MAAGPVTVLPRAVLRAKRCRVDAAGGVLRVSTVGLLLVALFGSLRGLARGAFPALAAGGGSSGGGR